jgi:3-oxoacyl-[acyl-carrier protein] reductase
MNYINTHGTAIIIGASTGIGRETALLLSEKYKHIAITSYKHKKELAELKKLIEEKGSNCYMETGDAGDYAFVTEFISHVIKRFGTNIDLLVNNAGISYVGLLTDMDISDWNYVINTNATSMFNSCRNVIPYMIKQQAGRIINVSSVWGNVGASCEVAYSASKGAVNAFTKALAKELAPSHISVNAVAFGAIDTEMNKHLSGSEKIELEYEIPYGRMATPVEAAKFILNLSEADNYLTGQVITFDGGWQ